MRRINELGQEQLTTETFRAYEQLFEVSVLLKQAKILSDKYDVSLTNPPYMGLKGMNSSLSLFVKDHFPDSKTDLFAVFMERILDLTYEKGFCAIINQHSWMFLSSFEGLRNKIINNHTILSMLHLGIGTFEEINTKVVQSTSFILRKGLIKDYVAIYHKLTEDYKAEDKIRQFYKKANIFKNIQHDFLIFPGSQIAYWSSTKVRNIFINNIKLGMVAEPKQGLITGDNDRFLKLWHEVNFNNIGFNIGTESETKHRNTKWYPINKGGNFRKWYGNREYVVNYYNEGIELKSFFDNKGKLRSRPQNTSFYFKESITWSAITSGSFSMRYSEKGFVVRI